MFESPDIKEAPRRRKIVEDEEFNWNTYDFPKPRELRDIKMEWSGTGMMKNDASEGFVSTGQSRPEQQPRQQMSSWQMPEQQAIPEPQIWFTPVAGGPDPGNLPPQTQKFTATGYVRTHPMWQSVPSSPVIKSFEEQYPFPKRQESAAEPEVREEVPAPKAKPEEPEMPSWHMPQQKEEPYTADAADDAVKQALEPIFAPIEHTAPEAPVTEAAAPEAEAAMPEAEPAGPAFDAAEPEAAVPETENTDIPAAETPEDTAADDEPEMSELEKILRALDDSYVEESSTIKSSAYDTSELPEIPAIPDASVPEVPFAAGTEAAVTVPVPEFSAPEQPVFSEPPAAENTAEQITAEVPVAEQAPEMPLPEAAAEAPQEPETFPEAEVPPASEVQDEPEAIPEPEAQPGPEAMPEPEAQPEDEASEEPLTVEDIIASVPAEEAPKQPRMFNTFYTKNEEFQKLLDQEYQKIIARGGKVYISPAITGETAASPAPSADPQKTAGASEDLSDFEKMLLEGTQAGDLEDATIPIKLSDLKKEPAAADAAAPSAEDNAKTKVIEGSAIAAGIAAAAEKAAEVSAAEAPKPAVDIQTRNDAPAKGFAATGSVPDIPAAKAVENVSVPDIPVAKTPDVNVRPFAEVTESIGPEAFVRNTIELKVKELKEKENSDREIRELRRKELERMQEARRKVFGTETSPQDMEAAIAAAEEARTGKKKAEKQEVKPAEKPVVKTDKNAAKKAAEKKSQAGSADYDEERRRHPVLTFVLILLIIAAVFEGGLFALKQYAPESGITYMGTLVEQSVGNFFKDGIARTSSFFRGLFNRDSANTENLPESLSNADYDFGAVVEANNRNIEMVVRDANLRRMPNTDYGISGFASMAGVGNTELLDSIYGTMIAYNSKWIDYINDGKTDVLDLMKADGSAYYNAVNFDKVGQISESFGRLALGEVVSDGNTVYVFDSETISVTSGEETSEQTREWIYELVKVGDEYKIVDYKAI